MKGKKKADRKESLVCFLPTPLTPRGNCNFRCYQEISGGMGSSPVSSNVALTCPEPLRHCTACLWVRPHRLIPSTCKSRSPGRGKMSCPRAPEAAGRTLGSPCPAPLHAASGRNGELSWEAPRLRLSTGPL